MSPSQLSQQRRDNLRAGKDLDKLNHPSQILLTETAPMASLQLSPHCCDNLRAVLGAPALKDLHANAAPEFPIERGKRHIRGDGHLAPRGFDHLPKIAYERRNLEFIVRRRQISRHSQGPLNTVVS